ncbi:MAG: hypothetical protein QXE79_08410 [Candidatus Bathyarchaeia archaeon]
MKPMKSSIRIKPTNGGEGGSPRRSESIQSKPAVKTNRCSIHKDNS